MFLTIHGHLNIKNLFRPFRDNEVFKMLVGVLANIPMLPICLAVHGDCRFTWGNLDLRREPAEMPVEEKK
jgi:hypothetical protein